MLSKKSFRLVEKLKSSSRSTTAKKFDISYSFDRTSCWNVQRPARPVGLGTRGVRLLSQQQVEDTTFLFASFESFEHEEFVF